MPKNLMRVNIFEPYELKDNEVARSHFNGRTKSTPTKYSFHFDTKLNGGSFYIEWEQIPQYILDKTLVYRNKLGTDILSASSVSELKKKIENLFQAYLLEYSEIKYVKKLGLQLRNNLYQSLNSKKALSIGIEYIVFFTKTYYDENHLVVREINVKTQKGDANEINTEGFTIYDYSVELENSIIGLERTMYNGMKEFILKMGSKESIISNFQSYKLVNT